MLITDSDYFSRDYDDFMDDLEENKEYRQTINIYKTNAPMPVDTDDMDDPDEPRITLEEMLDDLNIDEDEDDIDMDS